MGTQESYIDRLVKKLGQEGRATPDQMESLQSGGITLDAKPLGSTEGLWHPLKEPEMSESTESIETERLEEPGISSTEDKETHEASIQIRPRSNVLNILLNNTEHLLSAKCSERLTTLLSLVHPC